MSDPKQQEENNWKALQAELGLIPDQPEPNPNEPQSLAAKEPASKLAEPEPPSSMWAGELPVGREPLPQESPFVEGSMTANVEFAEEAETALADEPEPTPADSENEVEVGEAPEEIPEAEAEPEAEDEKRPRRRRGRRRRRSEGGQREETAEERESPEEPAAEEEQGDEGAGDEEDEEEVESVPFADWSVPSWQELIGSLYRPER
ncbi:MAG TPA: hypothetical protein VKS79_06440 [Gemmataceae bacterium]|nr:hypothetical protein [Gemmataceae bacterium]